MGKKIKGVIIVVIVAIIGAVFSYYIVSQMEYEREKFIGSWQDEEGKVYTFSKDGTFTGAPFGIEMSRNFEITDGQMILYYGNSSEIFDYFFPQDDTVLIFTRVSTGSNIVLTKIE